MYEISYKCFRITSIKYTKEFIHHKQPEYKILYIIFCFVPFNSKLVEKYFCLTAKYIFDKISLMGKSIKLLLRV